MEPPGCRIPGHSEQRSQHLAAGIKRVAAVDKGQDAEGDKMAFADMVQQLGMPSTCCAAMMGA
jgi:hypothetical protein